MASRRIALGLIWIIPFVLLISLSVGLVGFVSLRNGQQAVNELADQLIERTNQLVVQHLANYLLVPENLVKLNATALEQGVIDWQDFTAIGDYFGDQIAIYDLNWINYGLTSGEYAGAGLDNGLSIGELSPATAMHYVDFRTTEQGQRLAPIADPTYDFRTEAWYQAAMQAQKLTWSQIYLWDGVNDVISNTMALGIGQPIYRGNPQPIGAIGIDLSLTHISDFLRTLQVMPSARVFIIEEDGMVVATSSQEAPFTQTAQQLNRLSIDASRDPLIRATADYLLAQVGSFAQINTSTAFQFVWQGERQFVRVTPWHDPYGLRWLVITVVAASDFMGQIQSNLVQTVWLSLGALGVALGLGFFTARLITRPIAALKVVAQQIAAGQLDQQVAPSAIHEVDLVGQSFNQMAAQLQDSFAKLTYVATHDVLTGLTNRAAFRDLLAAALARQQAQLDTTFFAVLFLDLDGFKQLNDSLGHLAGDYVLGEVAQRLQRCIARHGHVARFGGDEFVILLDAFTTTQEVEAMAAQICTAIHQPFCWNDVPAVISTSIGVVYSSTYTTDVDSILRNADVALYRAKAKGKATYVVFADELSVEVIERVSHLPSCSLRRNPQVDRPIAASTPLPH